MITPLGVQPSITVYAADGGGAAATGTTNVSASQAGNTVTFTYTAGTGGMSLGGVKLTIPAGWTAPSTTAANAGYTTSSTGVLTIAARVVTVASVTLLAGQSFTITYGDTSVGGPGATATATVGAQIWQVQDKATSGGVYTNIGSSPSITVNAKDGAGTLAPAPGNVSASQTGQTITFTYTAAAGDMVDGAVTVTAPAGWSAPSTTPTDPGYSTASTGVVSAAGQTITVTGVSLTSGSTMTIVYGDTSGGGPGATAGSTTGAQTFQAQEQSTLNGVLANLAASPAVTVYAADGSGTDVASISVVSAGQTGRVVTLTYTPATGGMLNGSVTVVVPSGWTAPSTSPGPGYSTRRRRHAHRLRPDDHRHRGDAHRRADARDHVRLRQHGDRAVDARRADVAGAGGLDRGRRSHHDRVIARDHGGGGRRVGDDGCVAGRRLGLADRDDRGVHLHG